MLELRISEVTNSSCSVLATSHWNQKDFKSRFISICKFRHKICHFSQLFSYFLLSHRWVGGFGFFLWCYSQKVSNTLIWLFSLWHQQKYLDQNSAFKFYPTKSTKISRKPLQNRGWKGEKQAKIIIKKNPNWNSLLKKQIFSIE